MLLNNGLGWLCYCQNIHPAETWADAKAALLGPTKAVKAAVSPDAPFAVGLRFSAATMADLGEKPARADLKALLNGEGYAGITQNAFPFGKFHAASVKENVYQPDWRNEDRLGYTCRLADLMAEIAPEGEMISLSTVPGTFKPLGAGAENDMADRMVRAALHCADLEAKTGVRVTIAIEPEPFCFLETIEESIAYFKDYLFADATADRVAKAEGRNPAEVAAAAKNFLGLCYDVCHAAVEFEDPAASIAALKSAGVPIYKLQLSAALRIPSVTEDARAALSAFDEPTYLHQVIGKRGDQSAAELRRTSDLSEALAAGATADGEEWRVHFHVPIFLDDLGVFKTTQDFLADVLALHKKEPISPHLEIETYTWDVLPERYRTSTVDQAVTREMRWVIDQLT